MSVIGRGIIKVPRCLVHGCASCFCCWYSGGIFFIWDALQSPCSVYPSVLHRAFLVSIFISYMYKS